MTKLTIKSTLAAILLTMTASAGPAAAQTKAISEQDAYAIARDAYLYAYPIVMMDVTMQQATNVPDATTAPHHAPFNQFANFRSYPDAKSRDVVRFNFDTLYSTAWLDLRREPIVLSVPNTDGRYYLMPMLDMWSNVFAVPGTRTNGDKAGNFAVTAPGWNGRLPNNVEKIVAPTPFVWIIGRTQTNGPADYAAVHKIQDGYKLTPLSAWGKAYKLPLNERLNPSLDETPPQTQVNRMDGVTMLTRLAYLLQRNPPPAADAPILERMRAIGIERGREFNPSRLSPAVVRAINTAARDTLADMEKSIPSIGRVVNGWSMTTKDIGTYGTSYRQRAIVALAGLGANLPQDAVYPTAFVDADGQPLNGANDYVIRFEKGQLPPVAAFWSITMYDKDGFQIPNPINRFALGDRDKLAFNPDGSLEIYLQAESPGADRESNWLPSPKGAPFQPTMRLYSPRTAVLDGTWSPPGIKRVDQSATTGQK